MIRNNLGFPDKNKKQITHNDTFQTRLYYSLFQDTNKKTCDISFGHTLNISMLTRSPCAVIPRYVSMHVLT